MVPRLSCILYKSYKTSYSYSPFCCSLSLKLHGFIQQVTVVHALIHYVLFWSVVKPPWMQMRLLGELTFTCAYRETQRAKWWVWPDFFNTDLIIVIMLTLQSELWLATGYTPSPFMHPCWPHLLQFLRLAWFQTGFIWEFMEYDFFLLLLCYCTSSA